MKNQEDLLMAKKPTYEQLAQRIRELEKESAKRKQAEEKLHPMITIKTNLGSDLIY
jgi:hypothetical protein